MAVTTEVTGIFQSSIIVRSAIIVALKELRDDPNLIRDALQSLPQDDLTAGKYGEKTIEECVRWFTQTNCPVKLGLSLTQLTSPCIAVELNNGDEGEATIGDIDYNISEDDPWRPGHQRQLASVHSRESVTVTCFVQGEPEYLLFLSTLLRFGLLRHKEDLLDARGFARLTWSAGVFGAMPDAPGRENFFAHTLRLNGYVRHVWPVPLAAGQADTRIEDTPFGPLVAAAVHNETNDASSVPVTPVAPITGGDPFNPEDWEDRDMITGQKS